MTGRITSRERCKECKGSFVHDERRGGLFCPKHPSERAIKSFRVRFGKKIDKLFSSYDQATRFLNGIRFESDRGTFDARVYLTDAPLGFRKLSRAFVYEKEKYGNVAESTMKKIRLHISRGVEAWGDKPVTEFKKRDFKHWVRELPVKSSKTQHDHLATIKQFFTDYLVDEEYLTRSQVPEFPTVSFELGWRNFTDFETQGRVLDEVYNQTFDKNPKIHLGVDLLRTYPTMRPGDLLRIQEQDFNTTTGVLTLHRPTKTRKNGKKIIPLLDEHVETVKGLKAQFPALPNVLFFRWHGGEKNSARAGQPFGVKCVPNAWKKACKAVGLEGVALYGGTKHTTTTGLAQAAGREAAREATDHQTEEAFDRYCRLEGQNFLKMARVIRTQQNKEKGKVVNLKGGD